jgi:hypothetical protein
MTVNQLLPGDLVVVRSPGIAGWLIRFGAMLMNKSDLRNHVAMFHHTEKGVNWYLEGRPTGLGWKTFHVAADEYLANSWTITNFDQPKTQAQRDAACLAMLKMLDTPYDWEAISADVANCLRLPDQWGSWNNSMPGHVVCSSSADWAYRQALLSCPSLPVPGGADTKGDEKGRLTEPADWEDFIMTRAWEKAALNR